MIDPCSSPLCWVKSSNLFSLQADGRIQLKAHNPEKSPASCGGCSHHGISATALPGPSKTAGCNHFTSGRLQRGATGIIPGRPGPYRELGEAAQLPKMKSRAPLWGGSSRALRDPLSQQKPIFSHEGSPQLCAPPACNRRAGAEPQKPTHPCRWRCRSWCWRAPGSWLAAGAGSWCWDFAPRSPRLAGLLQPRAGVSCREKHGVRHLLSLHAAPAVPPSRVRVPRRRNFGAALAAARCRCPTC